jgi:hypothetical protein
MRSANRQPRCCGLRRTAFSAAVTKKRRKGDPHSRFCCEGGSAASKGSILGAGKTRNLSDMTRHNNAFVPQRDREASHAALIDGGVRFLYRLPRGNRRKGSAGK